MVPDLGGLVAKTLLKRVEPDAPELPEALKPIVEFRKPSRIQLVNSALRFDPNAHEASVFQHL